MARKTYYIISEGRKDLALVERQLNELLDPKDTQSFKEDYELNTLWGGNYLREVHEEDGKNYIVGSLSFLVDQGNAYGDGHYGKLFEQDFLKVFDRDAFTVTAFSGEAGLDNYLRELQSDCHARIGGRMFDGFLNPMDASPELRSDFLMKALSKELSNFAKKMTEEYGLPFEQLQNLFNNAGVVDELKFIVNTSTGLETTPPAPAEVSQPSTRRNTLAPVRRVVAPPSR